METAGRASGVVLKVPSCTVFAFRARVQVSAPESPALLT